MKLHPDPLPALNTVTAYGDGFVEINRIRHSGPIWLMPRGEIHAWPAGVFDALSADDLQALLPNSPELLLIGTGGRQRFLHPRITAPLSAARIGFELMSTQAACRTYNILMAESRQPLLALLEA